MFAKNFIKSDFSQKKLNVKGTSILLPKNMTLDITLNMDTSEKSLGLAAQMSVAL